MLPERPLMLLCDLEGTLLSIPEEGQRLHRAALTLGLREVTGLQVELPEDTRGHTDYTLVAAALDALALGDLLSEEGFELVAVTASRHYAEMCPEDLGWYVRPGVWSTLTSLRDHGINAVPCSSALAGIARVLIERTGLAQPLLVGFGSYGVYGSTRENLVEAACARAGGSGLPWPVERTVLASSSAENLAAAGKMGVRTIAVDCPEALASASIEEFELVPHVLVHWAS